MSNFTLQNPVKPLSDPLSQQKRRLAQQRRWQSQQYFQQALPLLRQALQEQFREPNTLQKAGKACLKAMQIDKSNPNPCLGFAYILVILENHTLASQYVKQALSLNPQYELSQIFLTRIEQESRGEEAIVYTPSALQHFDQIEAQIQQTVTAVQNTALPHPSSELQSLEQLEGPLNTFRQQYQDFVNHLKQLDWEFPTENLNYTLLPMEHFLARLEQSLKISKGFQGMYHLLETELKQVQECMRQSLRLHQQSELSQLEKQVEDFLDRNDAYTTKLEDLAQKGFQDPKVSERQRKFQHYLEALRGMLDDAQFRLECLAKEANAPL